MRNERGRAGARSELGEGEGVVGEIEESGLNAVGPQNRQLGLDCSPLPVRPVWARLTGNVLVCALPCEFKTNHFK